MPTTAVGIDLGTTNSCVGIFKNGKVEIIANGHGNRLTPSFVAFNDEVRLVGDAAKEQVAMNPTNTVFNVKRLIGQKFNDQEIQQDIEHWPFKVVSSSTDCPLVQVKFKGETKVFTPEEISSMILANLKKTAEDYLGGPVQNAVITVPAYFNDSQRQATKDAGTIAGFNVLGVLNEPTAAAIAYGLGKKGEGKKNVLIYDLGGGTFDVTILTMENGVFDVRSTSGNVHLGGEDFDNLLVEYFVEEIEDLHEKDVKSNPRALRRLRTACEKAKRNLSFEPQSAIELDALIDGVDFRGELNCSRFEKLCESLFQKTLDTVKDALAGAKMDKSEIDEVVLVGGSTRIPRVQSIVSAFFDGKELSQSINPDEAVACGAVIQAAILSGDVSDVIGDIKLRDVTPLSLGIEVEGDQMSVLIERNTKIPVKKSHMYTTHADNQKTILIKVYEGERAMTMENNLLGSFHFTGIKPAPRQVPKIEVTFDIDANGILQVSATDLSSGTQRIVEITNEKGRLTKEEIEFMVSDAEKHKEYDIAQKEKAKSRSRLHDLLYDVKRMLVNKKNTGKTTPELKKEVEDSYQSANNWYEKNSKATKEKYDDQYMEFYKVFDMFKKALGID